MHIAVVHCGFTYSGGGERIVLEEVLGLRRLGHDVDCYAPTVDSDRCYPHLMREVRPRSLLPQLPRWVPLRDAIQMLASSVLAPLLALTLPHYDAYVGANQPGAWVAYVVANLRRRPYVVYLNQPCRLVYPRAIDLETGWQTKRDYQVLNALIQRAMHFVRWADWVSVRGARALLVDGMFIGGQIERLYRRDVVDCPAGCHPETDSFARADFEGGALSVNGFRIRKPYVLLTNRHYPQKRFDFAIRAMAELWRGGAEAPLVVPGDFTGYTAQLRELVRELKVEDRVLFLGVITEAELERLYAEAAVYVYPSPEEDFGMGTIEAMAKAVPVVAWRHGGPTVTVADGETGFLALPYSVEDYAEKMALLLADVELNRRMGDAAIRRVRERFSWDAHVDRLAVAIATPEAVRPVAVPPGGAPRAPHRRAYTAVLEKRRLIAALPELSIALDAGAGGGEYVPHLLLKARRVVALDKDPVRVRELAQRFAHVHNVSVVQGSIDALPFPDGAFELVWASEVLEHLPTLAPLDELERVSSCHVVATMPSPLGPYRYIDPTHILPYSIGSLNRAVASRDGWSYRLEGFGGCLPQWFGLDRLRERWLAVSRERPWLAWTLLLRGQRRDVGAFERTLDGARNLASASSRRPDPSRSSVRHGAAQLVTDPPHRAETVDFARRVRGSM